MSSREARPPAGAAGDRTPMAAAKWRHPAACPATRVSGRHPAVAEVQTNSAYMPVEAGTTRLRCWDRLPAINLQRALALLDLESLDEIARLDVGRVLEGHAALEAGADFGNVVLEASQRGDRAVVDDDVVAHDPGLQGLADIAFGDEQAGCLAVLARGEDLADFGAADDILDH